MQSSRRPMAARRELRLPDVTIHHTHHHRRHYTSRARAFYRAKYTERKEVSNSSSLCTYQSSTESQHLNWSSPQPPTSPHLTSNTSNHVPPHPHHRAALRPPHARPPRLPPFHPSHARSRPQRHPAQRRPQARAKRVLEIRLRRRSRGRRERRLRPQADLARRRNEHCRQRERERGTFLQPLLESVF